MENIIIVYKKHLKTGLHEGVNILLSSEDCNQSDYNDFSVSRPERWGVGLCKIDSENQVRKVVIHAVFPKQMTFPEDKVKWEVEENPANWVYANDVIDI